MSVKAWEMLLPVWLLLMAIGAAVQAQDSTGGKPTAPAELKPDTVVAKVGDREIKAADVNRVVAASTGATQTNPDAQAFLQAQALEQLVQRELVELHLNRLKFEVSEGELNLALKSIETQLTAQAGSLDNALAQRGLTKELFHEQVAWELRWNAFARNKVTDQELVAWFDSHRRDFDGTELRCSHVLFRGPNVRDPAAIPSVISQANAVRADIQAGKLTFADAAKKFSAGPSREQGGDLGFIPRRDRMVEAFSSALFALKKGEISQPVVTFFGVHLIQCTDEKAGTKTWKDARNELAPIVVQDLFARLAAEERKQTTVEFTGAMPHLDPETGAIVPAGEKPSAK